MLTFPEKEIPIRHPDEAPIFVIGTGRSGTTLLRQILNAHPRIHITHEACFYTCSQKLPPDASVSEWLELYFSTSSFAWLRLDPQEIRDAIPRDLRGEHIAEAFRVIMRCKAQKQGRPRYGEKNPLDTASLGRIFRDFPDARVVYIMRDPRPTVLSFNRMPFGTSSALLNSHLCRIQAEQVQPYLDRILEVRLEDLTADPRTVLGGILRFVGEPWHEAVLDSQRRTPADDVPPLPWFKDATQQRPSEKIGGGGWQERMDPAWIRIVEKINRASMQHYGYEPAQLDREPSSLDLAIARIKDLPAVAASIYRMLGLKRKIERHFQGKELLSPQQMMEENMRLNPAAWRYYPEARMPEVPVLPPASGLTKRQAS